MENDESHPPVEREGRRDAAWKLPQHRDYSTIRQASDGGSEPTPNSHRYWHGPTRSHAGGI